MPWGKFWKCSNNTCSCLVTVMFCWLCLRKWSCVNILLFSTTDGSRRVEWMKPEFLPICLLIALHCNQLSRLMFLMSSPLPETQCAVLRSELCSWSASMCSIWPCCWCLIGSIMVAFALPFSLWGQKCKAPFPNPTSAGDPIVCAGMSALSWLARTCGIATGMVAAL